MCQYTEGAKIVFSYKVLFWDGFATFSKCVVEAS